MLTDETLARSLRALAHPRRVLLFRLLTSQPETGDSLDALVQASQLSTSSAVHHLREMERCGIVTRHRRGVFMTYRLTPGSFTMALSTALRMSQAARSAPKRAA
jgi:DNA-binding IclR family transcriptional regulator